TLSLSEASSYRHLCIEGHRADASATAARAAPAEESCALDRHRRQGNYRAIGIGGPTDAAAVDALRIAGNRAWSLLGRGERISWLSISGGSKGGGDRH